ncbi:MAG: hypothetical protein WBO45_04235 [Planctomycetota bacterium]
MIGALVLLAFAGFALLVWNFERPPFDLSLLPRLQPGMSRGEVEALLGDPSSRGEREWVYSRPGSWPVVRVWFSHAGTFERSEYDR